jgi:DNA processing protein
MFGTRSHARLASTFSTAEDAWCATADEILAAGIKSERVASFCAWRSSQDPHIWMQRCITSDIRLIDRNDDEYPELLQTIYDPPTYLFLRGAPLIHRTFISVVGSRHCTQYGRTAATTLASSLCQGGLSIVSGGAYGIDEAAHRGAIATNGYTVSVLGCGLLGIDNPRILSLNTTILEHHGTLISEFPLHAIGNKRNYPIRNRVVAGMSKATLLVEADIASGSMITADAATRENRDVCAIPGPITSVMSAGTNHLIKNGAHCITEAQDIFQLYDMNVAKNACATRQLPAGRSSAEIALFAVLSAEPLHIDDASTRAGLSASAAAIAVTQLELIGMIRDVGGKRFVR